MAVAHSGSATREAYKTHVPKKKLIVHNLVSVLKQKINRYKYGIPSEIYLYGNALSRVNIYGQSPLVLI